MVVCMLVKPLCQHNEVDRIGNHMGSLNLVYSRRYGFPSARGFQLSFLMVLRQVSEVSWCGVCGWGGNDLLFDRLRATSEGTMPADLSSPARTWETS